MQTIIQKLHDGKAVTDAELLALLQSDNYDEVLFEAARDLRHRVFGHDVYIRGLIEVSSFCKNDCLYCGIRRSNHTAERYRLTAAQILDCCATGYTLGFRTFVMQGGEDGQLTDDFLIPLIAQIKQNHPDCAVTLSLGERSDDSYLRLRQAGADRYLLRHETATKSHYDKLHPTQMCFDNRMHCLQTLKKLSYQTGCGMMVGSPYQTLDHLVADLRWIQQLQPEMVGIGPFVPHHATPFADQSAGDVPLTLRLLAIVRLLCPTVLLPATTALGTVDDNGREKGILAGANVVMPNLSPADVRAKYALYDNKLSSGSEAAESLYLLQQRMDAIGYQVVFARGDAPQPEADLSLATDANAVM